MSNNQKIITHTSKDHVNVVLDAKSEVVLVLLGQSRQVDIGVGQVDTLARRDEPVVADLDLDGFVVCDLKHVERQNTVVNIDDTANLDDLGDVLVVDIPTAQLAYSFPRSQNPAGCTYMFSVSQEAAYFSSVVKFITVPAAIGISISPLVWPVRISGPLVSRAMATWRPF